MPTQPSKPTVDDVHVALRSVEGPEIGINIVDPCPVYHVHLGQGEVMRMFL